MCGIVAISSPRGCTFRVASVLDTICHRGPDDVGVFVSEEGDCHLGHVRLSIIDLSPAGHQPMFDTSGRYVISYNGEVYNFFDLKRELEDAHDGIQWRSTSDTEVIIEGFAREGPSFFSKLNGIFALALYDKQERLLYVLRDPIGIKPLLFTEQKGALFFCSELKGLICVPGLKRTLRQQSLAEQLAFMYVPEPHTLFEEFLKVEPGALHTYREGRLISSIRLFDHLYKRIPFSSEKDVIEAFYDAFCSSVRRQLISDVPVSLMLSGGLDSSAVAYEIDKAGGDIRDAYTISFSQEDRNYDQQSDDLHFARIMAERLGLNLRTIPAKADFASLLPELSRFMEDGFTDPAAINTYLICQSARKEGVKVMLTGQGADEFLGGYRRYLAEGLIAKLPTGLRVFSRYLERLLPGNLPGRLNATNRRLKRLLALAGREKHERLVGMYIWNKPSRIAKLFQNGLVHKLGGELVSLFEALSEKDIRDAMMQVDHKYDLMSLNLTYTDRMSMAVGVEARVPFLDFELVRVMNSIPAKTKLKHGMLKYVLKKAMEPYLPREIVHREKAGFALPIRSWMRHDTEMTRHYFNPGRIKQQGIFNQDALKEMSEEQWTGKIDHSNTLFSMLCIQIWLDSQS